VVVVAAVFDAGKEKLEVLVFVLKLRLQRVDVLIQLRN
jgi:hypothetical protein